MRGTSGPRTAGRAGEGGDVFCHVVAVAGGGENLRVDGKEEDCSGERGKRDAQQGLENIPSFDHGLSGMAGGFSRAAQISDAVVHSGNSAGGI